MLVARDDLHLSLRPLFGYQKPFNYVLTPREPGKTTCWILDLFYNKLVKEHKCLIVLVDTANSLTDAYLTSIEDVIHKFKDEHFKFKYNRGGLGNEGIFDVYWDDEKGERIRAIRFIAYSTPIVRIKQTLITNVSYMIKDEFIKNPKFGEKYLKGEYDKFREIYSTYVRECPNLQCWFFGNPYSMYNPYFVGLGVDFKQLKVEKKPKTITSDLYAIHLIPLSDELRHHILKKNPLYQFDDSYSQYAVEGQAMNDSHIQLGDRKDNFKLISYFFIQGKYLSVWMNMKCDENESFYIDISDVIGRRTDAYCFDVEDLTSRAVLISREETQRFRLLKNAFRSRDIAYKSIECYYLIEEIFNHL